MPGTLPVQNLYQPERTSSKIALKDISRFQNDDIPRETPDHTQQETAPKAQKPDETEVGDSDVSHIETEVKSQVINVLYLEEDQLDDKKSFLDLGIDSILSVELIKKLNTIFSINISAVKLYDHPTISNLSKYIASVLPPQQLPGKTIRDTNVETPVKVTEQKQTQQTKPENMPSTCEGVVINRVTDIEDLKWQLFRIPSLNAAEVRIRVKASALNFPDILCIQGLYPTLPDYPFTPGFEVAGVISQTCTAVKHLKTGDEVICPYRATFGRPFGICKHPGGFCH